MKGRNCKSIRYVVASENEMNFDILVVIAYKPLGYINNDGIQYPDTCMPDVQKS